MPTYFQRPENALKRADEFIEVGKKQRALDALYDVIKSKKHRTWQKIHEPIMKKYLTLCVELRKSHIAKEGLYQYKNICQQVNIKSLEDVVREYLNLAEEQTEAARQESQQQVVDVDDLDILQTPESILLSAVSGEDTQDRTDRAILTPWVKFLWESYRQCLDLLRNNNRVERLYQDIAQMGQNIFGLINSLFRKEEIPWSNCLALGCDNANVMVGAKTGVYGYILHENKSCYVSGCVCHLAHIAAEKAFKFCLKYARKTEFRKLCDNLRTHLSHIHKHQNQQTAINLNNPDSQAMHLETRLVQLDSAVEMDLWQEAFKAVEDVHGLINISKKPPKPSIMANYYQKFGIIFFKSNNHLFHAAAWHKLFQLSMDQRKNMSQSELKKLSSRVLCATLAVPLPPTRNNVDQLLENNFAEKQRRLASLLGLPCPPSRATLIKDLERFNIVQHVPTDLQNLYRWLEVEFHPLKLSERVQECMKYVEKSEDLSSYVPALQELTVIRLLKQVYMTIEFQRFASLAPFATAFELEKIIVQAARNIDLQVRVDHRTRSLSFGTDLCVSQREDVKEGPSIQNMPSEQIRLQLCSLGNALAQAVEKIQPRNEKDQDEELRKRIALAYKQTAQKDHVRILGRRQIIEDRKEELEKMSYLKEQEEQEQQMEQERKLKDAEDKRLARERDERAKQRRIEEHKEIQRKHAKERLDQLKKSEIGARAFANIDEEELADLDADEIMAKQVEQLEKEKKELNDRLKSQEKKVDHFARAKRLEELPLLEKFVDDKHDQSEDFWVTQENERIEQLKSDRDLALEHKGRLSRMVEDKEGFLNTLTTARSSVYKEKLKSFEKHFSEEKRKRLAERKTQRREERRARWYEEKEEAEQLAREEALKKEREEKEREENERKEQEQAVYMERLKKLEEQAQKQKEREAEIERRAEQARMDAIHKDRGEDERRPGEPVGPWRPRAKEGGGWREREKERENSWRKRDDAEEPRGPREEPPREEGRWRREEPSRDEGRWGRREEAPRDEGRWGRRDEAPRDEGRWRRDDPPRDIRRDEGPRDFRRDDGPRDFRRDDMPRDIRRDEGSRDFRRDDGPRDFRRDEAPSEDRWRRDDAPRGDAWRRGGDDRRDDRGPPSDDRWRRGPPRDERGPSRDEDSPWRRGPPRDDRGPRDDRDGGWRRGAPPSDRDDDRRRGPPARDGPRRDEDTAWRRGGMERDIRKDERAPPPKRRDDEQPQDDGWTTVNTRR